MKNLYRIPLFAIVLLLSISAGAQTIIGYSNGYVKKGDGVRFGSGTKQGMAIKLTKGKTQPLKGASITGIRAVFNTMHISNLEVFVTTSLDAEPIYKEALTGASTSWKNFNFSQPVAIDGEEIYVGYTLDVLSESYRPLLFDQTKDFGSGLCWAYNDGTWTDITDKGYGAANIQLLVSGAPETTDLVMKPVETSGYYKAGSAYSYSGQLFNFGTKTIQSFDISCQVGNDEPVVYKVENANLASNSVYDFQLPEYMASSTGRLPMKVSVVNINGTGTDADESDNSSYSSTYIYPADVQKKILLEHFTGQSCSNCPAGKTNVTNAISGIEDEFVQVAHHAGYYPDAFSMTEDWEYVFFYNSSQYYAPAVMFNRAPISDGLSSPVFASTDNASVRTGVRAFRNTQPYVSINVTSDFDPATRHCVATVKVHTYAKPDAEINSLNVCLTQDKLIAYQSGAGNNYSHEHVFRGSLTGTWGATIDLVEGETVTKVYEFDLPQEIISTYYNSNGWEAVPENMHIVAFVSKFSESPLDWYVYNCDSAKLYDPTSGIGSVSEANGGTASLSVSGGLVCVSGDGVAGISVYNAAGQLVKSLPAGTRSFQLDNGFYVVRLLQSDGNAQSCKLLVK